ncbi:efflux RND transporter permease subunit [Aliikangiella coralliicola]|uniref:CusA/CzcA family heavy metal efflux RND transporter n=1 Tax=Aliikangiella coralliicola TaxID=2592383 RepID=A0A545UC58_9GAMM|nr:CusA/CzcA family heavy metal efflux RND transporter [Aliikangiella coralliicola]TQV87049.1 CusA/CzcA family heavy metal efflux RND transporter [Aliikangiella coralliicola]
MINRLIAFSVEKRWLILIATFLIAILGLFNASRLPIDAVPDITNIQVQINTKADGYSPLESEQRITYIVENAMAGIPKLDYTRSLSRYGLSQVTVIFEEGTDIYWARQQVSERLQSINGELPQGIEPQLGPIASGLGEIFTYTIRAEKNATKADGTTYSAEDLRTIQDWIIRPQLVKVPGITEINSIGGFEREYQVTPFPEKLLAYKVTIRDLISAMEKNNRNAGAGYIERNGEQWLVRSPGQLQTMEEIAEVVIAKRDDAPVRIKDVAEVKLGKQLRSGAATQNGKETVLGTAFMLLGENSRTVSKAVAEKLAQVNLSLPEGIVAEAAYNRTTLVDKTIATVQKNLLEGALLVIAVLFLLLGNMRAALITAMVIPLSMLFAITGMASNQVSGNLMSLGAIDFGLIVDGAVIVVENALRRLAQAQAKLKRTLSLSERLQEVTHSTAEVFRPAVFGVLIITLVYAPIMVLTGVEGKMFQPMAFTVIAALIGALIFSVTFVPAAVAIFVSGKISEKENWIMAKARHAYQPLLNFSLKRPFILLTAATLLVAAGGFQAKRLGTEFLPQLDEHDIALHALRIPGTGLEQAVEMQKQLGKVIREFDEVERVFGKIGTPEVATDPMPPNVADTIIILKPKEQWPDPSKTKAEFLNELRVAVEEVPGNKYEFTQPIEMRFNELIAGVRSDVAVRIYGDDLETLAEYGEKASNLLARVAGAKDVRVEQMKGLPMLSIEPQRDHMALLGLNVSDVQFAIQAAISGIQTGLIYEGDRRFKLLVRMDDSVRRNPKSLAQIPIALSSEATPDLSYVPLGEIATIKEIKGPNQINRQSGKRNVVATANVENRDLGSFIAETQLLMESELNLPSGYWIEYGGTFEQLESASQRLSIVVPVTLLLIFGLLFGAFNSFRDSLIIFTGIPLALTGGVLALTLRDMPLSISAAIGFIALSGISVLNGVVMISFIRDIQKRGMKLIDAIKHGASQRLRPILMTALVASLGFVPMAFNTGAGAEVQRPLATVVIGGIISSTLLTLVILPTLYRLVYSFDKNSS